MPLLRMCRYKRSGRRRFRLLSANCLGQRRGALSRRDVNIDFDWQFSWHAAPVCNFAVASSSRGRRHLMAGRLAIAPTVKYRAHITILGACR